MDGLRQYVDTVIGLLEKIHDEETENIRSAAVLIADALSKDKMINVFGPGSHSHMFVDELFFRAGGLAPIRPWLNPAITSMQNIYTVLFCEETPGFGKALIKEYSVEPGDVLIIANPNGINCCAIEVALEAKALGMSVIGVTSRAFSEAVPESFYARHESKKNLCDVVDIAIDCKQPPGDAIIDVEGAPEKVGAVSGVTQMAIANLLVVATAEEMAKRGLEVPIFRSGHTPGGREVNEKYVQDIYRKLRLI